MADYKEQYNAFIETLQSIFMMDHEELDFGIYRIMNYKREEINDFLKNKLLAQVDNILAANIGSDQLQKEKELTDKIAVLSNQGLTPDIIDTLPPIIQLREELKQFRSIAELKSDVFSALVTFFSRYYNGGDFISQRRYKSEDTYAIPYNGEEVKLYWANEDQYYIKSSEHFKHYSFNIGGGKTVNFVLSDADMQMNNDKNEGKKARRFVLREENPVEELENELNIYFDYKLLPSKTQQKTLNDNSISALDRIIRSEYEAYKGVLDIDPKSQSGNTVLYNRLKHYTDRNAFDYFIHKDLGAFLRRELDFFIKSEILKIDNLDYNHVKSQIAVAKTVKEIGLKIVAMLAQVEDFQKSLWLKKKFVVQADYCITLDRVPEELYEEIAACDAQREEWVRLFGIDKITNDGSFLAGYSEPLTVEFLRQNQQLVLDTAHFKPSFKHKLLALLPDTDKSIDDMVQGLLVNSDNFQALRLLAERYANEAKCVYIDPPYNTGDDGFAYKDNYQESSWLSCIYNRLELTHPFYKESGSFAASIDINEVDHLAALLDMSLGKHNRKANITVRRASITGAKVINPGPVNISENVLIYANGNNKWKPENAYRERAKGYDDRYGSIILNPEANYEQWQFGTVLDEFAKTKGVAKTKLKKLLGDKYDEELLNFAIENKERIIRLASLDEDSISADALELKKQSKKEPNKIFYLAREDANDYYVKDGNAILFYKDRLRWMGDGIVPVEKVSDIWDDVLPNDLHNEGGVALKKGKKPEKLINRIFESTTEKGELILDYFAGSATSGAVALKSGRKFINVEANDYFDEIPLLRIKNTLYGDKSGVTNLYQWKGGGCVKYIRLEQYEDTLNNLEEPKKPVQDLLTASSEEFVEDYMLHYMLQTETNSHLVKDEYFLHPFSMKMKITRLNEQKDTDVDMVETFNYLIGLHVERITWLTDNVCIVFGRQHGSDKPTVVIWRDMDVTDNEALKTLFNEQVLPVIGNKAYAIYVNGENTLQNLAGGNDRWTVKRTEKEFIHKMFEE